MSSMEYYATYSITRWRVLHAQRLFPKKTHSHSASCDSHLSTNLLTVSKEWLLLPGARHHFSHFHPSGGKRNLCIILKPIVAYLVGREHVVPTGCAFVCGSASFKFSFIPALLPTLWTIISCNIGHPRLCEAPAPFAFLIQMEHWWSDCRYRGRKLGAVGEGGIRSKGEAFITFDERTGSVWIHAWKDRGLFPMVGRWNSYRFRLKRTGALCFSSRHKKRSLETVSGLTVPSWIPRNNNNIKVNMIGLFNEAWGYLAGKETCSWAAPAFNSTQQPLF